LQAGAGGWAKRIVYRLFASGGMPMLGIFEVSAGGFNSTSGTEHTVDGLTSTGG
jgi:hypothetical protein